MQMQAIRKANLNKECIFNYGGEDWEVVIGLEIHAQIKSNSKLFSSAAANFGAEPNSNVSFVDAAMPGMLPVLNPACVEQAIKTGLALNCEINNISVFDRKNYFYADLPQGYQISQFTQPIVGEGEIVINMPYGDVHIGLERIHIEQDAGKSIHDQSPKHSFVDLNRSGVGLMEIVTKPDFSSANEVTTFLKKLRQIVRYVDSCDGDMDKGSMRCDANISVRRVGEEKLGTRNEIKNLNSMKFIAEAITYEVERQINVIQNGGKVEQATRLFDTNTGETKVMRTKENANDYRYFPDPDLYPLQVSDELIEKLRNSLPELPDAKVKRYIEDFAMTSYDAEVISADKEKAIYFDELVKLSSDVKKSVSWFTAELFGRLNKLNIDFADNPVSAENLAGLIKAINTGTINGKIAKDVLDEMLASGKNADTIIAEKNLAQIDNDDDIVAFVEQVIAENPSEVEAYRGGKDRLIGFFVGQVMKLSKGKANPQTINKLLKERL